MPSSSLLACDQSCHTRVSTTARYLQCLHARPTPQQTQAWWMAAKAIRRITMRCRAPDAMSLGALPRLHRIVLYSLLLHTPGMRCVALASICLYHFKLLRVATVVARHLRMLRRYRDGRRPGAGLPRWRVPG